MRDSILTCLNQPVRDLGEAGRIIPIGLVRPNLHRGISVTSIDANDWQASIIQLAPKQPPMGGGLYSDAIKLIIVSGRKKLLPDRSVSFSRR
jgi:hypothetical protein